MVEFLVFMTIFTIAGLAWDAMLDWGVKPYCPACGKTVQAQGQFCQKHSRVRS
jgi:hypothetical protein